MKQLLLIVLTFFIAIIAQYYPSSYRYYSSPIALPANDVNKAEVINESVIFTGDVMLGRHVEFLVKDRGLEYSFKNFPKITSSSTYTFINFESSIAKPHITTPSGSFKFSTDKSILSALAENRITHASLANNHSLDYGKEGYLNSISSLAEVGIIAFGHAVEMGSTSVVYIEINETKIGVLALHTLFVQPDYKVLADTLAEMRGNSELQFVYVHWGIEYEEKHSQQQRDLAEKLVLAGVDAVIGHHPHVVQDIEIIDGVPIFYSLGNTIFDQYFSPEVMIGYILELIPTRDNLLFNILPIEFSTNKSQPAPLLGASREEFLSKLSKKSSEEIKAQILEGKLQIIIEP